MPISPQILKLLPRTHDRTGLLCAILGKSPVEDGYLVIEFDGIDSKPLIKILTLWEFNSQIHVATSEGHLSNLFEMDVFGSLIGFDVFGRLHESFL